MTEEGVSDTVQLLGVVRLIIWQQEGRAALQDGDVLRDLRVAPRSRILKALTARPRPGRSGLQAIHEVNGDLRGGTLFLLVLSYVSLVLPVEVWHEQQEDVHLNALNQ